uniref:Vacuolar protein sorting-associated protein 54 n=1 Tax=Anopheles coluzzii TaxID=1518534 RepID=A0A8W7PF65_ANOCL
MIDCIARGEFHWNKPALNGHQQTNGGGAAPSPPQSVLKVEGEPFALVGAALLLVQIVSEYCRCASQLPVIAPQLGRNVVDLLRMFNSRCCQLVLGAGALHVAGLKTITSSNPGAVLWLLPHVKRHFRALEGASAVPAGAKPHYLRIGGWPTNEWEERLQPAQQPPPLPPTSASSSSTTTTYSSIAGYDSVEKDFVSHIKEIENKVLSIVCDVVTGQLNNWDARPPVPSQPFRNISRQFVKLHEAIAPILPEKQVHAIYRTVQRNFKDKLREQLLRNNITNNGGPQHGVVVSELTFYMETLRTLRAMPVAELHDDTMDDIWLK